MRVLTTFQYNEIGGVQSRFLTIAPLLRKAGFDLVAAVPEGPGRMAEAAAQAGADVVRVPLARPTKRASPAGLRQNARYVASLGGRAFRALARERRVDVLHANGFAHVAPLRAARKEGVPAVWHLIGTHYPRAVVRAVTPAVLRSTRALPAVVSDLTRAYYGLARDATFLLREPVDPALFLPGGVPEAERAALLREWSPDGLPVVGCVCHINPAKRIENLIEATALLRARGTHARVVVVGSAADSQRGYARKLRALVERHGLSERFRFAGHVPDVRVALAAFDVFALPSRQEGTPVAILEAMAMERPVVATRVGGVPELLDGGAGIFVPPDDPRALADRIGDLLADPAARARLGAAGRARVLSLFGAQRCADLHAEVYRALARGEHPQFGRSWNGAEA